MSKILTILMLAASLNWGLNMEKALEKAKEEDKLVFLYFSGSDWCGPCIMLEKNVLETDIFREFADKELVLVRADFPRKKKNQLKIEQQRYNLDLAAQYNAYGRFPYMLLLNKDGKPIREWIGNPKGFSAKILTDDIKEYVLF